MKKLKEYLMRAFLAAVIGFFISPIVGVIMAIATGAHGSVSLWRNAWILTGGILFFVPWTKDGAKEWVEEDELKEKQRKAYEKEQAEWVSRAREKRVANKKVAS
jgi:hypothetical protein